MVKKSLLLFLGLALPVLVFIFLKFFGRNEFDVPLPHADGVTDKPADCNVTYQNPYILADTVIETWHRGKIPPLLLLNFGEESSILQKIAGNFEADSVRLVNVPPSDDPSEMFLKNCALLVKAPADLVLIDRNKVIRGYYDVSDRDELDRLQAELTIILKKY